ncbi:unnamed protein product [Heligmosomoides polygyrus]|uniref:MADS-box domain-containing protein n=1 Tax=Heligmosomoides polygyrus TaxID=6339 RepID=A0A183GMH3_HELPZ|nr:unnamed protein product [Heligmosomoides polygyrus]
MRGGNQTTEVKPHAAWRKKKSRHRVHQQNLVRSKRQYLLSWLRANHVDVKECEDGSLMIFGAACIQSPFTEDSCFAITP